MDGCVIWLWWMKAVMDGTTVRPPLRIIWHIGGGKGELGGNPPRILRRIQFFTIENFSCKLISPPELTTFLRPWYDILYSWSTYSAGRMAWLMRSRRVTNFWASNFLANDDIEIKHCKGWKLQFEEYLTKSICLIFHCSILHCHLPVINVIQNWYWTLIMTYYV